MYLISYTSRVDVAQTKYVPIGDSATLPTGDRTTDTAKDGIVTSKGKVSGSDVAVTLQAVAGTSSKSVDQRYDISIFYILSDIFLQHSKSGMNIHMIKGNPQILIHTVEICKFFLLLYLNSFTSKVDVVQTKNVPAGGKATDTAKDGIATPMGNISGSDVAATLQPVAETSSKSVDQRYDISIFYISLLYFYNIQKSRMNIHKKIFDIPGQ